MKQLAVFLLIVLFISSCKKKEEEYILIGTVINPELNHPVGQAFITLWGTKVSSGVVQNQLEKLGSTYSSADGKFEFRFKKELYSNIKLTLIKENYFEQEHNINPQNLNPGKEYSIQVAMHITSWLKTIIKNVSPQYTSDQLYYRLSLPYQGCNSCCPVQPLTFNGIATDTTWICPVYGGAFVSILWIYSTNQGSTPHNDTLYIPANDTVVHYILY